MGTEKLVELKANYHNEQLASIVLNRLSVSRIYEAEDKLIQSTPYLCPNAPKTEEAFFRAIQEVSLSRDMIPYGLI